MAPSVLDVWSSAVEVEQEGDGVVNILCVALLLKDSNSGVDFV